MFTGSMVAIITPMLNDGAVDYPALERLIDFHLSQGTEGIIAVGTTGESATLSAIEHIEVVKRTVEMVAKRVPVIAGTGANSTAEAIELTQSAERVGADACLSVTPYYNKPTQQGLFEHFKAIAQNTALPVILYNVPGRTGVDMQPSTVARLAKLERIVAIKEAQGSPERTQALLDVCDPEFVVLSGEDPTACESMLLGAQGVISVTANVAPKAMRALCDAARAGNVAEARKLDEQLQVLHRGLFVESNPIPVKWACHQMGLVGTYIRLPLTPLSEPLREPLAEQLAPFMPAEVALV